MCVCATRTRWTCTSYKASTLGPNFSTLLLKFICQVGRPFWSEMEQFHLIQWLGCIFGHFENNSFVREGVLKAKRSESGWKYANIYVGDESVKSMSERFPCFSPSFGNFAAVSLASPSSSSCVLPSPPCLTVGCQ